MEGSRAAAGQQEQQGQQVSSEPSSSQGVAAQQLPPTHKPLTHNPPTSPKTTPWPSPATGSPFPQLARPDDSAMGVISSSGRADRMSPTAAPWVAAPPAAAGPPSSQLMTGRPVQGGQSVLSVHWGEGCGSGYQSTSCERLLWAACGSRITLLGCCSSSSSTRLCCTNPAVTADACQGVAKCRNRAHFQRRASCLWVCPPNKHPSRSPLPAGLIQAEARMPLVQPAAAAGFKAAAKGIQSAEDLKAFMGSDTAKDFVGFILALNAAVGGE